jgi:hypothetical protein
MDEALSGIVQGDHKRTLNDLRFLLRQYPDDVNALFYAGLCSYSLGLPERAEGYFRRVMAHPVDSFDEEAAWYNALSVMQRSPGEARPLLEGIATDGGFYADRARQRLNGLP